MHYISAAEGYSYNFCETLSSSTNLPISHHKTCALDLEVEMNPQEKQDAEKGFVISPKIVADSPTQDTKARGTPFPIAPNLSMIRRFKLLEDPHVEFLEPLYRHNVLYSRARLYKYTFLENHGIKVTDKNAMSELREELKHYGKLPSEFCSSNILILLCSFLIRI